MILFWHKMYFNMEKKKKMEEILNKLTNEELKEFILEIIEEEPVIKQKFEIKFSRLFW